MSATPRTDALQEKLECEGGWLGYAEGLLLRDLECELAEAKADTARLDFLEQNQRTLYPIYGGLWAVNKMLMPARKSVREAIDDAIATLDDPQRIRAARSDS